MLLKKRYTVKPVLLQINGDKKDSYRIKICIYDRRLTKRIYQDTDFKVQPHFWDAENGYVKRSHANATTINSKISNRVAEVEQAISFREEKGLPVNIKAILGGERICDELLEYFEALITDLAKLSNRYSPGTIKNYYKELNRLKLFRSEILFPHVDGKWLREYESWMIGNGLSNNSIHAAFKILKKVFNSAIKDGNTDNYPFKDYENPKYKQTDRTYLDEAEVQRIEDYIYNKAQGTIKTIGLYFLLGCYSGLRISDQLRFDKSMIRKDRMLLRAAKNDEIISIKIHERLQRVITELLSLSKPCPSGQKVNQYLKLLAEAEEVKITKHITTHVARHSFAVRCAEYDLSIEVAAKLMGISIRTCEYYYKVTDRKIDKEMEKWDRVNEAV